MNFPADYIPHGKYILVEKQILVPFLFQKLEYVPSKDCIPGKDWVARTPLNVFLKGVPPNLTRRV